MQKLRVDPSVAERRAIAGDLGNAVITAERALEA